MHPSVLAWRSRRHGRTASVHTASGELAGLWQAPDGSWVRFTGSGAGYTGTLVKLTSLQKRVGFTVGEQTFTLKRITPNRYEGQTKWRERGRQPWWGPVTLTVNGNSMPGWTRLE